MEKEIRFGRGILKVYDIFVLALIAALTILLAVLNGALQLGIDYWLVAVVVIGAEMAYIFGVVNKRARK